MVLSPSNVPVVVGNEVGRMGGVENGRWLQTRPQLVNKAVQLHHCHNSPHEVHGHDDRSGGGVAMPPKLYTVCGQCRAPRHSQHETQLCCGVVQHVHTT